MPNLLTGGNIPPLFHSIDAQEDPGPDDPAAHPAEHGEGDLRNRGGDCVYGISAILTTTQSAWSSRWKLYSFLLMHRHSCAVFFFPGAGLRKPFCRIDKTASEG